VADIAVHELRRDKEELFKTEGKELINLGHNLEETNPEVEKVKARLKANKESKKNK